MSKIKIVADTHTHSLACDHAYSTISENAAAAAKKGLSFLCLTEHGPAMTGAPTLMHFACLGGVIPRVLDGVTIIKGAEVNIMNTKGELDIPDADLDNLEWVIASMHVPVFPPANKKDCTETWLAIAANPLVDVIGHCGDGRYAFDEEVVLREFKNNGKIVEINSHSQNARPGSYENCRRIARRCAELEIPVVVSSDSHFHNRIGDFANSLALIEEIGFPEKLILNADYDRFMAVVKEKAHNL